MMNRRKAFRLTLSCLVMILPASAFAHDQNGSAASTAEIASAAHAPAAVMDAFHAALGRGDISPALDRLSDDAIIFDSGGVERSKAE